MSKAFFSEVFFHNKKGEKGGKFYLGNYITDNFRIIKFNTKPNDWEGKKRLGGSYL